MNRYLLLLLTLAVAACGSSTGPSSTPVKTQYRISFVNSAPQSHRVGDTVDVALVVTDSATGDTLRSGLVFFNHTHGTIINAQTVNATPYNYIDSTGRVQFKVILDTVVDVTVIQPFSVRFDTTAKDSLSVSSVQNDTIVSVPRGVYSMGYIIARGYLVGQTPSPSDWDSLYSADSAGTSLASRTLFPTRYDVYGNVTDSIPTIILHQTDSTQGTASWIQAETGDTMTQSAPQAFTIVYLVYSLPDTDTVDSSYTSVESTPNNLGHAKVGSIFHVRINGVWNVSGNIADVGGNVLTPQ